MRCAFIFVLASTQPNQDPIKPSGIFVFRITQPLKHACLIVQMKINPRNKHVDKKTPSTMMMIVFYRDLLTFMFSKTPMLNRPVFWKNAVPPYSHPYPYLQKMAGIMM